MLGDCSTSHEFPDVSLVLRRFRLILLSDFTTFVSSNMFYSALDEFRDVSLAIW